MGEDYDDRTSVETRTLLDFVSRTPADEVPAEVLHESTRCLLDHLGLAIAGAAEPAASIAREQCLSARRRAAGHGARHPPPAASHRRRAGQRNRLPCTGFRRHPRPDHSASHHAAVRRGHGAGGVARQPGHRPAGRARPRVRARGPRQQRALPRALRRGLAHDRDHRRAGLGDGRDQAARARRERPRRTA